MRNEIYTRDELLAYAMIYAAMADFTLSEKEKEFITERIGKKNFEKMYRVYENDTDVERIERVELLRSEFFPGEQGKEELLKIIKDVFNCDHEFDALENAVYHSLRMIL